MGVFNSTVSKTCITTCQVKTESVFSGAYCVPTGLNAVSCLELSNTNSSTHWSSVMLITMLYMHFWKVWIMFVTCCFFITSINNQLLILSGRMDIMRLLNHYNVNCEDCFDKGSTIPELTGFYDHCMM